MPETPDPAADAPVRPLLRVVRGEPSPEELAALVAVLTARGGAAPAEAPAAPRLWRTPLRPALPLPGPGRWRTSALPL